jgi:hypothetical protein
MSPIVNLPTGYWMASLHFGGTALPLGATVVIAGLVNTGDTPSSVGTAIITRLRAAGGPLVSTNTNFSSSATFQDVLVKFGPLDTGPAATVAAGGAMGSVGADAATPATAVLINKSTGLGGRRGRGRMFFPGISESVIGTGGFLLPATVTSLQSAFTQFNNAMTSAGQPLEILHRYDPALGESPMAPTGVLSLDVQALAGTQRQRMRR